MAVCGLEFDLLKLHVHDKDRDPCRSWIRTHGTHLQKIISSLIGEIQSKKDLPKRALAKELSNKIGCSESSCIKYLYGKKWVPLIFIDALLQTYREGLAAPAPEIEDKKKAMQSSFEWLKVGARNSRLIKAVKFLTPELCKIAGAYAADGTVSKDYIIELSDKDRRAVDAFAAWLENTFKVQVRVKFSDKNNSWKIVFCNKVIARYLNVFFGFPYGEKTGIVEEPESIKRLPQKYRRAFACGVMTFDGSIDTRGKVRIELKSRKLRDTIVAIAKNDGLFFCICENKKRGHFSASSPLIKGMRAQTGWLAYFEEGTEKWFRAKDFLFGFRHHVNNFEQALSMFDRAYGFQPTTKITISDGVKIAGALKVFKTKDFMEKASNSITSVTALECLKMLRMAYVVQTLNNLTLDAFVELVKYPTNKCTVTFERPFGEKFIHELMRVTGCKTFPELASKLGVPKTSLWYWLSKNGGVPIKKLDEFSALIGWNRKMVIMGIRSIKAKGNIFRYNPNILSWKIPYRPLD